MPDTLQTPADEECFAMRAYLRMRACSCSKPGGPRGMVVQIGSTCKTLFPDGLAAQWLGPEATEFFDYHESELVPGRCLDLLLYHFRTFNGELRARIKTCSLAPLSRSWVKHAEKSAITTEEHHA